MGPCKLAEEGKRELGWGQDGASLEDRCPASRRTVALSLFGMFGQARVGGVIVPMADGRRYEKDMDGGI